MIDRRLEQVSLKHRHQRPTFLAGPMAARQKTKRPAPRSAAGGGRGHHPLDNAVVRAAVGADALALADVVDLAEHLLPRHALQPRVAELAALAGGGREQGRGETTGLHSDESSFQGCAGPDCCCRVDPPLSDPSFPQNSFRRTLDQGAPSRPRPPGPPAPFPLLGVRQQQPRARLADALQNLCGRPSRTNERHRAQGSRHAPVTRGTNN
jgi:hypothetical protein